MKPGIALAVVAALLAGPGLAQQRERPGGPGRPHAGRPYADPSAVIAAEIAFAQLAQEKGQWTAFRATAAKDAEMFVPQRVLASKWLKRRADPPVPVRWQPHDVWMSCDGSIGLTRGASQMPDGSHGTFTTIWQRQRKGGYKWVLDQGSPVAAALARPEMIAGKIADCRRGAGPVPAAPPPAGHDAKAGRSADMTLQWSSSVAPDGSRMLSAWLWNGTAFDPVLNVQVAAHAR